MVERGIKAWFPEESLHQVVAVRESAYAEVLVGMEPGEADGSDGDVVGANACASCGGHISQQSSCTPLWHVARDQELGTSQDEESATETSFEIPSNVNGGVCSGNAAVAPAAEMQSSKVDMQTVSVSIAADDMRLQEAVDVTYSYPWECGYNEAAAACEPADEGDRAATISLLQDAAGRVIATGHATMASGAAVEPSLALVVQMASANALHAAGREVEAAAMHKNCAALASRIVARGQGQAKVD